MCCILFLVPFAEKGCVASLLFCYIIRLVVNWGQLWMEAGASVATARFLSHLSTLSLIRYL